MQVERTKPVQRTDDSSDVQSVGLVSGERVSNTWVTCPEEGDNCSKEQLIPHVLGDSVRRVKLRRFGRGLRPIS